MTDIAFHTGIADPLDYACRLLRKAYRSGSRVAVHAPPAFLDRLDQALWTFEALEFVPHLCLPRDSRDAARLVRTPVFLVHPGADAPACAVGVALAGVGVPQPQAYERVIEVIGQEPGEPEAGRRRWRDYERAGHALTHVGREAAGS